MEAQKRLTLEGNIVISVGLFGHSGDDEVWTEGTKAMLVRGNVVFYGRGVQNDVSHPRLRLITATLGNRMNELIDLLGEGHEKDG